MDYLRSIVLAMAMVALQGAPRALADEPGPAPAASANGPKVDALLGHLSDEDALVRAKAARMLGELGPPAKAALPALRQRLKDDDEGVRQAAQTAIAGITPAVSPAVQGLIDELSAPEVETRAQAIAALGSLGASAQGALVPLGEAANAPEPAVRIAALRAIASIEAAVQAKQQEQPLRPAEVAGTYVGAEIADDGISEAIWKMSKPGMVPGLRDFETQPAAPTREKVRQLFQGARWVLTRDGDILVQITWPPGWEHGFNRNTRLRLNGTLSSEKPFKINDVVVSEKRALTFSLTMQGTSLASQVWIDGAVDRKEAAEQSLSLHAKMTLTSENILECTIRQTLELADPAPNPHP